MSKHLELAEKITEYAFSSQWHSSIPELKKAVVVEICQFLQQEEIERNVISAERDRYKSIIVELEKHLSAKGVDTGNCINMIEAVDQLLAINKAEPSSETHIHHHWHTPTNVEQVGGVVKGVPALGDAVSATLLELGKEGLWPRLAEQMETDAFSTIMARLKGQS